jgi:hypothetical protein
VTVTIKNTGPDAYQPDRYGDSIKIERKISPEGTGTYNLKHHDSHTVSRSGADLTAILDHFNIQVENPLMILNQDVAREFLTSKAPTDMYKVRTFKYMTKFN